MLEPTDPNANSRPLTFGIWACAAVASAVVAVYVQASGRHLEGAGSVAYITLPD